MIEARETRTLSEAKAAQMLDALGSRQRLLVYRSLLRAGAGGMNISTLQSKIEMPASTLKHHLVALVDAGLVVQNREGREVYCSANYHEIRSLANFLLRECCADDSCG